MIAVVDSKTSTASVAVLEDHEQTAKSIREELQRDGKEVEVATSLAEFENLIRGKGRFDVCSIDWKIGERYIGNSALDLIERYKREAGKVVYSVYVDQGPIRADDVQGRADFVLKKRGENYGAYREKVEQAAKLGISRQISRRLDELGRPLSISFTPTPDEERTLLEESRRAAKRLVLAGDEDELLHLLRRRGWWIQFNVAAYPDLPAEEKLLLLLSYAGAGEEDVRQILQCTPAEARALLADHRIAEGLARSADEMLSVLAYLLRLSGYEPELVSHYWTVTGLFDGSLSSPPWDTTSLRDYLKSSGVAGIREVLYWIRSH